MSGKGAAAFVNVGVNRWETLRAEWLVRRKASNVTSKPVDVDVSTTQLIVKGEPFLSPRVSPLSPLATYPLFWLLLQEIIDKIYENTISAPFSPVPLPAMVDILVDIWECQGEPNPSEPRSCLSVSDDERERVCVRV